jgi:membrane-bound serine protease (ClpP class)
MEEILINPNIAYLLLVAGFLLFGLAVVSPGTGILEIASLFVLLVAAWEVYNLTINPWALVLMLVSVIPFILAVRSGGKRIYLILSILGVTVGSWFLFPSDVWWQPAVNPLLFALVTILAAGFLWVVITRVIEAAAKRPSHDIEALIGASGEAKTRINTSGSVQVDGELWTARSKEPIPAEAQVRVVGREGFILEVEEIPKIE